MYRKDNYRGKVLDTKEGKQFVAAKKKRAERYNNKKDHNHDKKDNDFDFYN